MNRIEVLSNIIDVHIDKLSHKEDPILNDTKTLTEILKAILVLEQIKNLEGRKSTFDEMSDSELEAKMESLE